MSVRLATLVFLFVTVPVWVAAQSNQPGEKAAVYYPEAAWQHKMPALAALNVWRRPLPQVLKETIMDPIGAPNTWRWFGYENSWVVLDGGAMDGFVRRLLASANVI